MSLEHLIRPENKEMLKKQKDESMSGGHRSQQKEL
jgi:hypothetical protein